MTLEEKWRRLEQRASEYLSRPLSAPRPLKETNASVVALIWRYPSFEAVQSWALVRQVGSSQASSWLARRVTWNRDHDYARVVDPLRQAAFLIERDPMPTIDVADASIDEATAVSIRAELELLDVPSLMQSGGIGIDGITCGIETEYQQVRVEWWCEGPTAWRDLTIGVERLRLRLEAAVANQATQPTGSAGG